MLLEDKSIMREAGMRLPRGEGAVSELPSVRGNLSPIQETNNKKTQQRRELEVQELSKGECMGV